MAWMQEGDSSHGEGGGLMRERQGKRTGWCNRDGWSVAVEVVGGGGNRDGQQCPVFFPSESSCRIEAVQKEQR